MIRTKVVLPDVHLNTEAYDKSYNAVRNFIAAYEPYGIIILGDFLDMESLSHWNENKALLMENKRYRKEMDVANYELDFLQRYSKEVIYIEGNHENWAVQYVERHPEVEGLIDIQSSLKLRERGIKWVEVNELYEDGNMYFTHGMYTNQYHAKKHLERLGCNVCYGHTHNSQTHQINMKMQEPFMAYGLGCLCGHEPIYMRGKPCNWINQFAIFEVDTKSGNFNLTPINVIDGKFMYMGKQFK